MQTAIGLVVLNPQGQPIPGCVVSLEESIAAPLTGITNRDGYMLLPVTPVPFVGTLKMSGACAYYEQAIDTRGGQNVTLRVGGHQDQPQDVVLPAAVPFV